MPPRRGRPRVAGPLRGDRQRPHGRGALPQIHTILHDTWRSPGSEELLTEEENRLHARMLLTHTASNQRFGYRFECRVRMLREEAAAEVELRCTEVQFNNEVKRPTECFPFRDDAGVPLPSRSGNSPSCCSWRAPCARCARGFASSWPEGCSGSSAAGQRKRGRSLPCGRNGLFFAFPFAFYAPRPDFSNRVSPIAPRPDLSGCVSHAGPHRPRRAVPPAEAFPPAALRRLNAAASARRYRRG